MAIGDGIVHDGWPWLIMGPRLKVRHKKLWKTVEDFDSPQHTQSCRSLWEREGTAPAATACVAVFPLSNSEFLWRCPKPPNSDMFNIEIGVLQDFFADKPPVGWFDGKHLYLLLLGCEQEGYGTFNHSPMQIETATNVSPAGIPVYDEGARYSVELCCWTTISQS